MPAKPAPNTYLTRNTRWMNFGTVMVLEKPRKPGISRANTGPGDAGTGSILLSRVLDRLFGQNCTRLREPGHFSFEMHGIFPSPGAGYCR
jgi:hypothetical protein